MRDLVNKFFGRGQEEEAPSEAPDKASKEGAKKTGASPATVDTVDPDKQLVAESMQSDPATPKQQMEPGSDAVMANDKLMSDASGTNISMVDETAMSDSEAIPSDQLVSQPSAIDDTAVSLKPVQLDEVDRPPAMLQAAHYCHIGNVRSRNEDSTYMFTAEAGGQEPLIPFGLYIVADGMGGHHAGHEASKNVSRIMAQHILERIYLPLLKKSTLTSTTPQEPIRDVMLDAIQIANQKIHSSEPGKESGTTLTAVLIFGSRVYITQIGDSRAYLLSEEGLKQITTDHSYVRRLIDAGDLTEEEAAVHPQRNMLYKAVGQGASLEIDTFTQTLPNNGTIILCSDGLWGLVSNSSITRVAKKEISLWEKANELVSMGLQAGGHDNISIILVSFNF